jgi:hypothetical protein
MIQCQSNKVPASFLYKDAQIRQARQLDTDLYNSADSQTRYKHMNGTPNDLGMAEFFTTNIYIALQ